MVRKFDGITWGLAPELDAYMDAPRPAQDAFTAYLHSLDESVVRKVHTVMYVGCCNDSDVVSLHTEVSADLAIDEIIETLVGRVVLAEYLIGGRLLLQQHYVDIEGSFD